MATAEGRRRCTRCGGWLARDNTATLCSPCQSASPDRTVAPPDVPPDFWQDDEMRAALDSWHMGKVIRAYRQHKVAVASDTPATAGKGREHRSLTRYSPPVWSKKHRTR